MKKFNKNIIFSIVFMVILQLVTPLLALAESGNSLKINTSYKDDSSNKETVVEYVDYWKIPDEKAKEIQNADKKLELIDFYKDKNDEEISKDFGEMKSSKKSEEIDGMYFAMIDSLAKGSYLLRYRSNDSSRPYIPFIETIDENTENPLTIYPKKSPDWLILTKRDSESRKELAKVGFKVINKKGETLKFKKIKDEKGNEKLTYAKDGNISEIFTDENGQIKIFGLEEEVKFVETKPLKGYESNIGKESEGYLKTGSIEMLNKQDKPKNFFSFQKIDGTNNNPLKGAIFKVQYKDKKDDKFKDLYLDENGMVSTEEKDGRKIYTLTSGEKGDFVTQDLPYGQYCLIETKAPQGYVPELESVPFEIGENSFQKTIKVKNFKPPISPQRPRLSKRVEAMKKTGDATIYLILLLGLIMIGFGVKLVKAKE